MSVFQPLDVRGPANRRKQLVAKLMQQQAARAPIQATGNRFGTPTGGAMPGVNHNNVLAAILSKLGVSGPADADSPFGPTITPAGSDPYGSGHYVSPREVGPGTGSAIPGGNNPLNVGIGAWVSDPNFPGGGYYNDAGTGPSMGGVNPGGPMVGPGAPIGGDTGQVPLGGGMYYDPTLNQVIGGGNAVKPGVQI